MVVGYGHGWGEWNGRENPPSQLWQGVWNFRKKEKDRGPKIWKNALARGSGEKNPPNFLTVSMYGNHGYELGP